MCILCAIQRWSRSVATMLPWLVIPLIGLWALSQLLPPALRFEITSPRLACVFVLLVTLFWYEVLMPQLSAWRVRRNARLKEKARLEAIELDKLRKNATRRCRNCLTPYRDQNPGGGRFMCSYCGHVSKRPVLDVPLPSGMQATNDVALKDVISKAGRVQNWKMWPGRGWMCRHDWLDNDNCISGPYAGKSTRSERNIDAFFAVKRLCFAEKLCSGVLIFFCKLLNAFFISIRWLWRKIFRTSGEDDSSRTESSAKRSENGSNLHESKGEKARRKAEEKRQARLEKELLEEEERKQREEVARLIEERRKQRDVKVAESGRDRVKVSVYGKDRNVKKEAEKKRQEKRKDKDKESSKSNSDVEELEKRVVKNSDRKGDLDKTDGITRPGAENVKAHHVEAGHGLKNNTVSSCNKGYYGRRYLDRVRGTFFSPTKAFSGGSFFRKAGNSTVATKENMSSIKNFAHTSVSRRGLYPPERAGSAERADTNGSFHNQVLIQPHPVPTPKKSWQQLFARSPVAVVPTSSNISVISRPLGKVQLDGQTTFRTSSPFGQDIFEDPCYDPDPGHVSGSLPGFEGPHPLKNASVSKDAMRPSPIESPISRIRGFRREVSQGGIWQMWNTTPLGQDGLSLVSGGLGWLESDGMRSGECNGALNESADNDKWLQDAFFPPLPGNEHSDSLDQSAGLGCWPKKEWNMQGSGENAATGSSASVPVDKSLWSYHHHRF